MENIIEHSDKTCLHCNSQMFKRDNEKRTEFVKRKYCSHKCYMEHVFMINNPDPNLKKCSRCKKNLDISMFSKCKTNRRGLNGECKLCQSNRNLSIEYKPSIEGYKICSKCKISYHITYFYAFKKRPDGRESSCKKCCNIRKLKKLHTDKILRIKNNLRSRIIQSLKGAKKSLRTLELTGCSLKELKIYIESKFTDGMSWENHGFHDKENYMSGWQIDHIRPCASFDLTDLEQQKQCFHYTNLQPLWAIDNLTKGDKYEQKEQPPESEQLNKNYYKVRNKNTYYKGTKYYA